MKALIKIIFIFILLGTSITAKTYKFSELLKQNEKLYNNLRAYYSNRDYIAYSWKNNDQWETNLILETSILGREIYNEDNKIPSVSNRSAFLIDFADHLFYKDSGQSDKVTSLQLWQNVLKLDLKALASFDETYYSNYQSPVNTADALKALRMFDYHYRLQWLGQKLVDTDTYEKIMGLYLSYYQKGLNRGIYFEYYLGMYCLETGREEKAFEIYENLQNKDVPELFKTLIQLEAIYTNVYVTSNEIRTNTAQIYQNIKNYLSAATAKESFTRKLQYKFFDYANTLAFGYNQQKRLAAYNFQNLTTNISDLQNAVFYYNKALEIDPDFAECNFNKALIYIRLGRIPQANLVLGSAVRKMTSYNSLYTAGLLQMQLEEYKEAAAYFKEALLFKTNAVLLNNLALAELRKKGRSKKADILFYINKAINLDLEKYVYHVTKAEILKEFKDERGSKNELEKAIFKLRQISYNDVNKYKDILYAENRVEFETKINRELQKIARMAGMDQIEPFSFDQQAIEYDEEQKKQRYEERND